MQKTRKKTAFSVYLARFLEQKKELIRYN